MIKRNKAIRGETPATSKAIKNSICKIIMYELYTIYNKGQVKRGITNY